jgi:hypothetical protein
MNKLHLIILLLSALMFSCTKPLLWPDSPLYSFNDKERATFQTEEEVKQALVGHYAHFDVVSYADSTTQTPMNTFIISYGFTDFYIDSTGNLIQRNQFVHAEQKINQPNIQSKFKSESIQAIQPKEHKVEISKVDGSWQIYRPATPFLLGITGDASKPLSKDKNDPNLTDPDKDGKPGVTVEINLYNLLHGEIYITRREIFNYYLWLNADKTLTGHVVDHSEQFVVGASMKILEQESNTYQHPDKELSPILLVPIDASIDTPEELMAIRNKLFPKEPEFVEE